MVKKQNNVWLIYLIALIAIVALILAAIAFNKANMTGQGIFNWQKQSQSPPSPDISANSCNADGICEIQGQIHSQNDDLEITANDFVKIHAKALLNEIAFFNEDVIIAGLLRVASLNVNASNMIPVTPVSYVCVDANGILFKKSTPCV